MEKTIYAIGKDFKVAKHEYDEERDIIGAQCSEREYPDRIIMYRDNFQSYCFNIYTLACLNNIFDKEELMVLYRIIDSTSNTENGTYLTIYKYYDEITRRCYLPCNLYQLSEALSVQYSVVKKICDILMRDKALFEYECYVDRYCKKKDKCYFFNSDFINYADGSWFREKEWEFDEDRVILWYQSIFYDVEYQKDKKAFIQKCKDGWDGEKESDDDDSRNSPQYKKWVKDVKDRDKVCQCCGSSENLDIHHIIPYATHKKLRVDINNGIALCELHHSAMILGGFHQTYGTRNNTPEQLLDYIKSKRNELGITDTSFIKSPLLLERIEEL